ncbi:ATP-binding protein [Microbacterium atlanticum]|uniref:ATP-binding protein n=1 Tax=Microbacterium atlanticum TaxID=2782168 RepID=UPI001887FD67|nr:ATP-binding protein [Microbacterium atlanticum]
MTTGLIRSAEPVYDPRETDSRVRTVWIWQLSFAAVVGIITVLTAIMDPLVLSVPPLALGVAGVVGTTVAALIAPWHRYRESAASILAYLDIVWVGLLTFGTDLRLSHLWVFPIAWLAALFSFARLVVGLGLVAAIGVAEILIVDMSPTGALRVLVALLALAFVGVTVHATARQGRAYRTLLRRQARRIRHSLDTVSVERRRVSDTLDGVHIAIARINRSGELMSLNTAYRDLYGLDDADPGRPPRSVEYDSLRGTALRENARTYARAARGEELEAERVWLYDDEGHWHALSVTSRRQEPRPDEEPSTVLIAEDVTEMIAADRRRDALAAVISHELRNPLTGILGHTDRLLERDDLDPDARQRLSVIEESGERMLQLITTILSAPPDAASRADRDPRAVSDLRAILDASVESFAVSAAEHRVALALAPGPPVQIWGDAFRLRQMLDNLIGNAVKYTPSGGTVRVAARRDDGDVEITVADSGIGIPPADLPRVFEHYFRSRNAVDSGIPGTGIGLQIVRDVVDAHGGTVDIASEPGTGTTVTVHLPAEAS